MAGEKDHHATATAAVTSDELPDSRPDSFRSDQEAAHGVGTMSAASEQPLDERRIFDTPHDPLTWSWLKKHAVLWTLVPGCFLTDGVITYGTSVFVPQAMEWHMSVQDVSQSISGAVFMQGPGGLLAVAFCQRYGRLPTLFWSQFLLLVTIIGSAGAGNYAGFTAARTLQGFFAAAPQVVGLSMIYDMFHFEERARKVNLWAFTFLLGPYISPFISALLAQALGWRDIFWVLVGFSGFSVLNIMVLGDETLFDRSEGAPRDNSTGVMRRVKLLVGITGAKLTQNRPSIWETQKHQWTLITKPYVLLPCFGFIMPLTMWTIGLVNTVSQFVLPPPQAQPPGYGFTTLALALLFLAPMIGVALAELFGHIQNDAIASSYRRRHAVRTLAQWPPEVRLRGVYAPWAFAVAGLILYGQALQQHLHWLALAFGWGMQTFGTLGTTTAISAYLLDVLPGEACQMAAWLLQGRVLGGFTVTYFQLPWVLRSGPAVVFGSQAGIIGVAVLAVAAVQVWGSAWRAKFPPPPAEE